MTYFMLILVVMLMMGLASQNVQMTFKRFSKVPIRQRMSGAQAARYILDANGLQHVAVERVHGNLTDHYDPRSKVLRGS
ncbi:MAG TPA: zinc metallopeptidase [bacterium]|nr:zinc metallopeptidase [bacterium]